MSLKDSVIFWLNRLKVFVATRYIKVQQYRFVKGQIRKRGNLIIFLLPPAVKHLRRETISGGVLSIDSIFTETRKLVNDSNVFLSNFPESVPYSRFSTFESESKIVGFNLLRKEFNRHKRVLIHVPELLFDSFIMYLKDNNLAGNIRLNILNQNIDLMPEYHPKYDNIIKEYKVSQTTAHQRYLNHKGWNSKLVFSTFLGTFADPESYTKEGVKKKQLTFSPDNSEYNRELTEQLGNFLDDYDFVVISGLKYEKYIELIGKSIITFTFGEGLDFYFIETVFSGGIGVTIYNNHFMPEEMKSLPGVYGSFSELRQDIDTFLRRVENEEGYAKMVWRKQMNFLSSIYSFPAYQSRLVSFYEKVGVECRTAQ